jgi:sugar diacid utilization regulator
MVFTKLPLLFTNPQAEMEMVARGLEKLMKLEERQSLLKTFVGMCCSEDSQRSAAEALGLVHW